ncbi:MAG: hypothetical protein MSH30_04870 [Campylobacter sp.]|uniref:hypothetical protein n=1 Tax=Campylobacter sp. TaxID=205 RepID=UPI002AA80FFF|nr:hypothetical protein [Campylobacter sp.]MCI6695359.1 hypothetical protein [Campylobacter sp.]MCI7362643.1 hypothetical protein [Campylobacter sp.]MDD6162077.1 hypothetical protein [Campylobacteraceae bacterium]
MVADGFKGLAKILYPIPFQICQVHIQRSIQTKLTKKPKSLAGIELLELSKKLTHLSKQSFIKELEAWQEKHKEFLNEKSVNDSGRLTYTHQRLRSAHYALKLFTFQDTKRFTKNKLLSYSFVVMPVSHSELPNNLFTIGSPIPLLAHPLYPSLYSDLLIS